MKDLLSVKEFAQLSGVESSTLIYWDKIGLFSPWERNPENNYRYYSITQLLALNFVTTLSDINIPLKTISALRKNRNPKNLLALLNKKEKQMDMELRNLRQRYSIIHTRRELIDYGIEIDDTQISIRRREDKALILGPHYKYQEGETFVEALAALVEYSKEGYFNLSFPIGGYYENIDRFRNAPERPERFFSIDPIGKHLRKAGEYVVGFNRGYYGALSDLPKRKLSYAEQNSLFLTGPIYVTYLIDEICAQDPSQYLAQAISAFSKKKR